MTNFLKLTFFVVILIALYQANAQTCSGGNCSAASCGTTDVQNCINSTTEGKTCTVPAGTCSWTAGVTISGKGINLAGAGGGRVIAVDVETTALTLATGSKTFSNVTNDMGANAYLNATAPPITVGETLLIYENGFLANFMEGTVTSFSGSTLVMNITSKGGTCGTTESNSMNSNCKRWLITTLPSTIIQNNSSSTLVSVTEDASVHTTITGFQFAQGSGGGGTGETINIVRNNPSGIAVLIHDNFFEANQADIIDGNSNRGVIWNNSFVFSPFIVGQYAVIRIKDSNNSALAYSWNGAALWGSTDTTYQGNLYFETNDIHASQASTDWDDNARAVFRYNVLDNAGLSSHGADTSWIGMRDVEIYDNAGIFEAYSDGSSANMANGWFYMRGGTMVWFGNTLPSLISTDWGNKPDIDMLVMNLQRSSGLFGCWGGDTPTSAGEYYPAPHQVGLGYVTGTGKANYPPGGYTNISTYYNGSDISNPSYVGDSEPVYIWGNSRSMVTNIQDYGLGTGDSYCSSSPTAVDHSANYIESGRDYFNGTAKPGYSPATYPNPLTQSSGQATPSPPVNLKVQTVPN